MLTLNALTAADRVIIPVQSHYLPVKGLEQLLRTVSKVQRQLNSNLKISGILITMTESRTNFSKEISQLVRDTYGKAIRVYDTEIPRGIKAVEMSARGTSIFSFDPRIGSVHSHSSILSIGSGCVTHCSSNSVRFVVFFS